MRKSIAMVNVQSVGQGWLNEALGYIMCKREEGGNGGVLGMEVMFAG